MRRVPLLLLLAVLAALSIAAVATAGRADRTPGVRDAGVIACPDDGAAKPTDDKPGGGHGGTNRQAGDRGDGTPEPAVDAPTGRGAGESTEHGSGPGHGNHGDRGNGNGGGTGYGEGGGRPAASDCVEPPATPTANAVAGDGSLPPARAGKSVNIEPLAGTVAVKEPASGGFEPLTGSDRIPEGSIIDARRGTVELTSAGAGTGGQQTAAFTGAKFQVRQTRAKPAVTDLVLRGGDFRGCPRLDHARRAQQVRNGIIASRTRRGGRRRGLWGNGRGRFRTRGRWGSATVRGTVWKVEDSCGGTRTTVARGVVDVMDFGRNRRVSVRAGQTYFAKVRVVKRSR